MHEPCGHEEELDHHHDHERRDEYRAGHVHEIGRDLQGGQYSQNRRDLHVLVVRRMVVVVPMVGNLDRCGLCDLGTVHPVRSLGQLVGEGTR